MSEVNKEEEEEEEENSSDDDESVEGRGNATSYYCACKWQRQQTHYPGKCQRSQRCHRFSSGGERHRPPPMQMSGAEPAFTVVSLDFGALAFSTVGNDSTVTVAGINVGGQTYHWIQAGTFLILGIENNEQ
eukprot:scaffold7949_cov37-Cyclotella_meneghiniana.AAC.4